MRVRSHMTILKKLAASAVILAVAALAACGQVNKESPDQAAEDRAEEKTDEEAGTGQAETPEEVPEEEMVVAAVSRSIGDLWLLAGGELAGMTQDGMDLPGITEETKVIGTVTNPSLEAIAALSPDMVLLSGELPTHKKLAEDLEERGFACRMVTIDSFADYDSVMAELTAMTGREDCYQTNVTDLKERIGQVLEEAEGKDLVRGTYLALRVSAARNKALKNDYFACEIFNDLGLANIAQDNSAFDELNLEAILDADPDIIFVIEQGKSEEAQESFSENFSGRPVWQELSAVKNDRVWTLPKEYFQYKPNAKWDEAYRYVMELLEK